MDDAQARPGSRGRLGQEWTWTWAGDDGDDMDMGGDDMDMDMDMEMAPSGIPLAEGGEDRDGLEMDVLHLPLGPVLPHWPAGLVLRCALQGDVVVEATAEVLAAADAADGPDGSDGPDRPLPTPEPSADERAARCCDEVADPAGARRLGRPPRRGGPDP